MRFTYTVLSIALITLLFACGINSVGRLLSFEYEEGRLSRKVLLRLPPGFTSEIHNYDDDGAREQQYWYKDSALLYIAFVGETNNASRFISRNASGTAGKKIVNGLSVSGVDDDGYHWKEVRIEKITLGYQHVSEADLERFNQALSTVKMKK